MCAGRRGEGVAMSADDRRTGGDVGSGAGSASAGDEGDGMDAPTGRAPRLLGSRRGRIGAAGAAAAATAGAAAAGAAAVGGRGAGDEGNGDEGNGDGRAAADDVAPAAGEEQVAHEEQSNDQP